MSLSVSRSRSRGRSMVRSGSKRPRGALSVSSSRTSKASREDGYTRRGWNWPQSNSKFFDPFPRTMRAILRYSQQINLDGLAGSIASHYFRAGSIYDPDQTGTGHQPYGHDTYASIYNHYRVIKSVCKVSTGSNGANAVLGLSLTDDTAISSATTHDSIREMKPTKFINLCGSYDSHSLAMTYDSRQAFPGGTQNTMALFNNNPAEEMYFWIWSQGNLPGNNPGAIALTVCIEYYCEFSELQDLGSS